MARCFFAFSAVGGVAFALYACTPELDKPALASLDALVEAYDHPPGVLTDDNVGEIAVQAAALLVDLESGNPAEFFVEVLSTMESELEERGVLQADADDSEAAVRIDAAVRLRVPCPGPDPDVPSHDGSFGSLELVTRIDDNRLAAVAQGTATACWFPITGGRRDEDDGRDGAVGSAGEGVDGGARAATGLSLDGQLFAHHDFVDEQIRVLLSVDGTLTLHVAPERVLHQLDLRVSGSLLETRVTMNDMSFVVFRDQERFGIRDARTTYSCKLQERVCEDTTGGVLRW